MDISVSNLVIMAKKIILIVLLSAVYLLMQGSDQSLNRQYKSYEDVHDLIWRGKVPLCSGADSCVNHNRFCPSFSTMKNQTDAAAASGINHNSNSTAKADTSPQVKESMNESRLGILEYLIKWINLVLKMS